jgi:hypothetical protein
MTDYTPKKSRQDSGVNADTPDLAAWDHRLGDPERPDWCDLGTGADVRLDDVNQPSSYDKLPNAQKADLREFIRGSLLPADGTGPHASYSLKHIYERLTRHYTTNGAFKGAMLAAGFEPLDRHELNWRFSYRLADPKLRARSIEASVERRRVA